MGQKNQISFFELVRVDSPGTERMKLFARTLSDSGIFLYCNDPLAEGTPVSLTFSTRFGEVKVDQAQVISQHSPSPVEQDNVVPGMMIRFDELSAQNKQILHQTIELETTQVASAPTADKALLKEPPTLRISDPTQPIPAPVGPPQFDLEIEALDDAQGDEADQMTREVKYDITSGMPLAIPSETDFSESNQTPAPPESFDVIALEQDTSASLLPPQEDTGFSPGPPTLPVSQDTQQSIRDEQVQPTGAVFHPGPPTLPDSQNQPDQTSSMPAEEIDIPIDVVEVEHEDNETLVILPNEGRVGKFILTICLVIGGAITGLIVLLKLIDASEVDYPQQVTKLGESHQAPVQPSEPQTTVQSAQVAPVDPQSHQLEPTQQAPPPQKPEATVAAEGPNDKTGSDPVTPEPVPSDPATTEPAPPEPAPSAPTPKEKYAGPKPTLEPAKPTGQVSLRMIRKPFFRRSGTSWKLIFGTDQLTQYNLFTLDNPSRLVVDFMQATLARNAYIFKPRVPFAKKTRTVRRDGFVRFVLDFANQEIPRYQSKQNPKRIEIEFFLDQTQ